MQRLNLVLLPLFFLQITDLVQSDHVDPVQLRDLFLMEQKLLGLLFPLVRESNETSKFVQMALAPHLEIASFGKPGWTKNRVVMEKLVGNQDHVFGLVERLSLLPLMLEQIKEVDNEAFKKIELIINKHTLPADEDFTKQYSSDSDKLLSTHCSNNQLKTENSRKISKDAQLCRFVQAYHPSLLLAPLKIEVLSDRPALVLVHDVLTKEQRENMLNSKINTDSEKSQYYDQNERNILKRLSQNLAIIKTLGNTEEVETGPISFELAGYAPGTHVTPDYLDTASAFMVFMNYVSGGAIVFPDIGLKVEPTEGSAIVSYNFDNSEANSSHLKYGLCPVTRGVLWVAKQV